MVASYSSPNDGRNIPFENVLCDEFGNVVAFGCYEGNSLESILDIGSIGDK